MEDQTASLMSLKTALESLTEGRKARGRIYPQWLLLCIICLAKLCGYHHFTTFARFIRNHQEIMGLLGFERSDLPCDDTFRYALKHMTTKELEIILGLWSLGKSQEITKTCAWQGVSVDGKELKGSGEVGNRDHLVALYHHQAHAVLSQGKVKAKSNEIPIATSLLEEMDLVGLVIVADALLTQKKLTSVIESRGGRYLLSLKGNHQAHLDDLKEVFRTDFPPSTWSISSAKL
jgi:DDE_Tnp_1-associated/Transposase DDE domain